MELAPLQLLLDVLPDRKLSFASLRARLLVPTLASPENICAEDAQSRAGLSSESEASGPSEASAVGFSEAGFNEAGFSKAHAYGQELSLALDNLETFSADANFGLLLVSASDFSLADLLRCTCLSVSEQHEYAQFVDCRELLAIYQREEQKEKRERFLASIAQHFKRLSLLALHRVDCMIGDLALETFLFELYNARAAAHQSYGRISELKENSQETQRAAKLLISLASPLTKLPFKLEDLRSRLQALTRFGVPSPGEDALVNIFIAMAKEEGMEFDEELARYVIFRIDRRLDSIREFLNRLDLLQRRERRALTLPLVRKALS